MHLTNSDDLPVGSENSAAEATGQRCLPVPTDVKNEEQVIRLVQRTVDELGRIDILVNNAGGARLGPLSSLPTKAWDASFQLNVRSAYLCTREAGRHFVEQRGGAIVNVSSDGVSTGSGVVRTMRRPRPRCRCLLE